MATTSNDPNLPPGPESPPWEGDDQVNAAGEVTAVRGAPDPDRPLEDADADWILDRILRAESTIVGLEAYLETVRANIGAEIARHRARIKYLEWRYGSLLESYARRRLAGRTERAVHRPFGTLSLRIVPSGHKITDMQQAVGFVRQYQPEAIQVKETVAADDAIKVLAAHADDLESPPWLEHTPRHESFKIEANVRKKGPTP